MAQQTKFLQTDGVFFDPATLSSQVKITADDATGDLVFYDQQITGGITLSKVIGLESIANVLLVGKVGDGAAYTTIQAAINAVSDASNSSSPTVILITGGVYTESLTVQKDGVVFMGLGYVEVQGAAGSPTVLLDDTGSVTPLHIEFHNMSFTKSTDGEKCFSVVSTTASTTLLSTHLLLKDCNINATGIGSYMIHASVCNTIKVYGGDWSGSRSDSICSIAQTAKFELVGVKEISDFNFSYDSTGTEPSLGSSSYVLSDVVSCQNFLGTLSGRGSLSLSNMKIGTLSLGGDQTLSIERCTTGDLTIDDTTVATINNTKHGTISGTSTGGMSLDRLRGSVAFAGSAAETVTLPIAYANATYMVLVDGYIGANENPNVTAKTATSFTITYSGAQTTTVYYQVLL